MEILKKEPKKATGLSLMEKLGDIIIWFALVPIIMGLGFFYNLLVDPKSAHPHSGRELLVILVLVTGGGLIFRWRMTGLAKISREDQENREDIIRWGFINPAMICLHCQTKGQVRSKRVKRKQGISGGKVTGAVLTGGLSLLATGLSRKGIVTQARCDNCNSTWDF